MIAARKPSDAMATMVLIVAEKSIGSSFPI
jgi:hypothetical protein